jgi:hypothetical protein
MFIRLHVLDSVHSVFTTQPENKWQKKAHHSLLLKHCKALLSHSGAAVILNLSFELGKEGVFILLVISISTVVGLNETRGQRSNFWITV